MQPITRAAPGVAIFLVSVLTLFLEMMLIRWIGTDIRIFAYLQNTILVMAFLGLGMGCFWSRRRVELLHTLVPLLLLTGLLALPPTRSWLRGLADQLGPLASTVAWTGGGADHLGWLLLNLGSGTLGVLLIMTLVATSFVPLGQLLARLMDDHPRIIVAYSLNVAGSLLGTWLFASMSMFTWPPVIWALGAVLALVPFLLEERKHMGWRLGAAGALVLLTLLATLDQGQDRTTWSPYQKLTLTPVQRQGDPDPVPYVLVNNTGYQAMFDLRPAHTRSLPELHWRDMHGLTQYDLPFLLHGDPRSVLLVGAGSGNDAAGALRNGAGQVVAVDIDPVIVSLGWANHPERPYDSERVQVVVDDARAYFAESTQRFDVVAFGLLDSHTTTSLSNARLDHYVYTRESIHQARGLMAEGGVMSMTFAPQHPWIVDRIARTLTDEFGEPPIFFEIPNTPFGLGGVMFLAGDQERVQAHLAELPRLQALMKGWEQEVRSRPEMEGQTWREHSPLTTAPSTDDWPYLYLPGRSLPLLYVLLALLVGLAWSATRRIHRLPGMLQGRWARHHWHFALLGGAFLLLEVHNISKASVVLGNTWQVSAVIVSGVLVMVLAANGLTAAFRRIPLIPVYALLLVSCLGLYFLDLSVFLPLARPVRALVVGAITCLPMLFGGIVFIRSFAGTPHKDEALGANLVGSLVGALVQSITFVTGTSALLLVVAALYAGAIFTAPRE